MKTFFQSIILALLGVFLASCNAIVGINDWLFNEDTDSSTDSSTDGDTDTDTDTDTDSDTDTDGDTDTNGHNCSGVCCNEQPPNGCADETTLEVFSPIGWCVADGSCNYASFTEACITGLCVGSLCVDHKCQGTSCVTPPMPRCDGDNLMVSNPTGFCSDATGGPVCAYAERAIVCDGGCEADRCVGNPCAGILCEHPPARYCDGDDLVVFDVFGRCDGGACQYASQSVDCGDSGCTDGHCNGSDVCETVSCDKRPAAFCLNGTTLRTFPWDGVCDNGACRYDPSDVECFDGCVNGQCVGDPCAGVSCDRPTPAYCRNGSTLVHWNGMPGMCVDGVCDYETVESACTGSCASGACTGDPCQGVICMRPPASYCVDEVHLRTFFMPGTCVGGGFCSYESSDMECMYGCQGGACQEPVDTESDSESDSDSDTETTDTEDTEIVDTETVDTDTVVNGVEWTTIPAGSFWMGTPDGTCPDGYTGSCTSELGRSSNETLHYVTLTQSFEIMRTEVTQGDFAALMGWNPSYLGPNGAGADCGDTCPVETVSWFDAVAYANELSHDVGYAPCYLLTDVTCNSVNNGTDYMACMNTTSGGIDSAIVALNGVATPYACEGYRLPTESEWEYAIRAGSSTAFYPSDGNDGSITHTGMSPVDPNLDQIGWFGGNNGTSGTPEYGTKPVGGKEANAWGLYDMSGNVWEWTWDWYSTYPAGTISSPTVDPTGAESASDHAVRGGFWHSYAYGCRSGVRYYNTPDDRHYGFGFRLSRSVP